MLDDDELTSMRATVTETLVDSCVIREASEAVYDPDQGIDVVTAGTSVYSGACRIAPTGGERVVMVGEAAVTVRTYDLTVPWSEDGFAVDQVATITVSGDSRLVGREFRIVDVQGRTYVLGRRLVVEEVLPRSEP